MFCNNKMNHYILSLSNKEKEVVAGLETRFEAWINRSVQK